MYRERKFLLVIMVFLSLACGLFAQAAPATQTPVPPSITATVPTPTREVTFTFVPSAVSTPTQLPTATGPAIATIDSMSATLAAQMGSMGGLSNISMYFHPIGTPLANWRAVPIMSEATAGQEFPGNIYSYSAKATLDRARQFYAEKAQSLGLSNVPATGFAGSGSQATHQVTFFSFNLTIVLASYDNDTGNVIVVISKLP